MSPGGNLKRIPFLRALADFVGWIRDMWQQLGPVHLAAFGEGSTIRLPRTILGGSRIFVGRRVYICPRAFMNAIERYGTKRYSPEIRIEDDVYIGRDCYLNATRGIEIGEGCVLSEGVYIADEGHGLDPREGLIMKQNLDSKGPVKIGAHTFIGLRAAILPGVTLGERCIVGTGSVVTGSFPAYSMVGGVPARLLKVYDPIIGAWMTPREEVTP